MSVASVGGTTAVGHGAAVRGRWRPSASESLCLLVLVGLTYRHRWVMDDATIYFRYIDNWLLLGRGLVFNAGEYVEGYTSPLWLLLLAAGRLVGLGFWTWSLCLGLLCAAAAGLGCVVLSRRVAPGLPPANLPLALLAAHYGTQAHFTSGLETGLVQLSAVLVALWSVQRRSAWLSVALGLTPLVRPELALVVLLAMGWFVWTERRLPWALLLSTVVGVGSWLMFRIVYYADLLPNTYYLKGHADWSQGLSYLLLEVTGAWVIVAVASLATVGALLASRRAKTRVRVSPVQGGSRDPAGARGLAIASAVESDPASASPADSRHRPRLFMWMVALALGLWTVRIGGDMGYHRFFAFPVTLLCCAFSGKGEETAAAWPTWVRGTVVAVVVVAGLCTYPTDVLSDHPLKAETKSLQWRGIEDGHWHRTHPDLIYSDARGREDDALRAAYRDSVEPGKHHKRALKAFCQWAYLNFDIHVVHTYGLTDGVLARVDSTVRRPGHRNLWFHARDLLTAQNLVLGANGQVTRGMYRAAVAKGKVAPWIKSALPTIEAVERKIYNRHSLIENLKLATQPVARIPR